MTLDEMIDYLQAARTSDDIGAMRVVMVDANRRIMSDTVGLALVDQDTPAEGDFYKPGDYDCDVCAGPVTLN